MIVITRTVREQRILAVKRALLAVAALVVLGLAVMVPRQLSGIWH